MSLKALDIDYIDLYLLHWPQAGLPFGTLFCYISASFEDDERRQVEGWNTDGKIFPPDQSPTFVETWLKMEKLLETGASPFANVRLVRHS